MGFTVQHLFDVAHQECQVFCVRGEVTPSIFVHTAVQSQSLKEYENMLSHDDYVGKCTAYITPVGVRGTDA